MSLALVSILGIAISFTSASEVLRNNMKNFQWNGGPYDWPCEATKSIFQNTGRFIGKNVIATRGAIYKDEAFLALPRYKPGVPATLAKMSLKNRKIYSVFQPSQAHLSAFPNWIFQEEGFCKSIQNAVDIFLDPQDILWVLDTGIVNTLEEPIQKCPPKVVAINAKTEKIVKVVDLKDLTSQSSRFQYIVADYNSDGRVFIYISDAASGSILIYDVTSDRGYRIILPHIVNQGCDIQNVLYLALIRHSDGTNWIIFTYLCGSKIFSIRTDYLQTGTASGKLREIGEKHERMVILGTDNGNYLFFRYEGEPDIYRWDTNLNFNEENFEKVYDGSQFSLPTQVMADFKRGRMRVLESNFPDFIQGTVGSGANQALNLI